MARPRDPNPSPEALRKRAQRERKAGGRPSAAAQPKASGRLIAVTVWVAPQDEKAMQETAKRFRHAARIPESEVPDDG